jgi:hypothetical protein
LVPVLALLAAVLALIGSAGWVAGHAGDGPWGGQYAGSYGPGMMMGGRSGPMYGIPGDGQPVTTLDGARSRAQLLADQLDDGLRAAEVMQFTSNFYVELVDAAGHAATEVLVDPDDGAAGVEYGPAMMWNTRYGMPNMAAMGGGMRGMGGRSRWFGGGDRVGADEARRIAEAWLSDRDGLTAGPAEEFPGYYTLHTLRGGRDGRMVGMLSVRAATGQVWYHSWHGRFIAMSEG